MRDTPCLDTGAMMPGNSGAIGGELQLCSSSSSSSTPPGAKAMRRAAGEEPYTLGSDPDLWLYRERTLGLLRRYRRLSVEVGRLPSLLGREFFRTQVTSYRAGTFEDAVIFVHDVARGLERLDSFDHKLIAKIVLQDYTHNETARLLGCWRRTVGRRFPEALDQLTDIFLEAGLLVRLPTADVAREKNCQEGEIDENTVSDSQQWE
jgi:DNA-directed RNA polymerase specialized sigma24 family protein